MIQRLLRRLSEFRLAILVIAGAIVAAGTVSLYWFNRAESSLVATYSFVEVSLPTSWRTGLKVPATEVLTIHVDKVWSKRIEIDQVAISGVKEIHAVTLKLPERVKPSEPTWKVTDHASGVFRVGQVTDLPPLLAGPASLDIYIWGRFSRYPFLDVEVKSSEANFSATLRESYSPLMIFVLRNFLWFAIILGSAAIAGVLIYVDKKKDASSSRP